MFSRMLRHATVLFVLIAFFMMTIVVYAAKTDFDHKKCDPLTMDHVNTYCPGKTSAGQHVCGIHSYVVKVKKQGQCNIPATGWKCTEDDQVSVDVGTQTCRWRLIVGKPGSCKETTGALTPTNYTDCSHKRM